jgi:hypothetical protein
VIREKGSDAKMSDCTSALGTACKDPACPLHFPAEDQPAREMAAAVNLRELGS